MRAAGCSWAAIGKKLQLHARTPSNWVSRYPVAWAEQYTAALAERDEDAEAESIRTLRDLLRVDDAKVQREAARELLRVIRAANGQRRAAPIDPTAEAPSHESLEQIIRAFDSESPVADGTPGPAAGTRAH